MSSEYASPARTEISLIIFRQQTGRDASTRMFQVGAIDSESFRELTQSPTLGCSVRLPAQPARRRGRRLSESQRKKTNQETRNSGITGGTASVPSMFRKTGVSPVISVSVKTAVSAAKPVAAVYDRRDPRTRRRSPLRSAHTASFVASACLLAKAFGVSAERSAPYSSARPARTRNPALRRQINRKTPEPMAALVMFACYRRQPGPTMRVRSRLKRGPARIVRRQR